MHYRRPKIKWYRLISTLMIRLNPAARFIMNKVYRMTQLINWQLSVSSSFKFLIHKIARWLKSVDKTWKYSFSLCIIVVLNICWDLVYWISNNSFKPIRLKASLKVKMLTPNLNTLYTHYTLDLFDAHMSFS